MLASISLALARSGFSLGTGFFGPDDGDLQLADPRQKVDAAVLEGLLQHAELDGRIGHQRLGDKGGQVGKARIPARSRGIHRDRPARQIHQAVRRFHGRRRGLRRQAGQLWPSGDLEQMRLQWVEQACVAEIVGQAPQGGLDLHPLGNGELLSGAERRIEVLHGLAESGDRARQLMAGAVEERGGGGLQVGAAKPLFQQLLQSSQLARFMPESRFGELQRITDVAYQVLDGGAERSVALGGAGDGAPRRLQRRVEVGCERVARRFQTVRGPGGHVGSVAALISRPAVTRSMSTGLNWKVMSGASTHPGAQMASQSSRSMSPAALSDARTSLKALSSSCRAFGEF